MKSIEEKRTREKMVGMHQYFIDKINNAIEKNNI